MIQRRARWPPQTAVMLDCWPEKARHDPKLTWQILPMNMPTYVFCAVLRVFHQAAAERKDQRKRQRFSINDVESTSFRWA